MAIVNLSSWYNNQIGIVHEDEHCPLDQTRKAYVNAVIYADRAHISEKEAVELLATMSMCIEQE